MNDAALKAAYRLSVALKDQTRTHYAPEPRYLKRKRLMTTLDARTRALNGRRNGPQARQRRR